MARILDNRELSAKFFLMKVSQKNNAVMGQFYMLRAWVRYPMLSRPISVFDTDGETLSFLYKAVGEGTRIFANLKPGEEITLQGPRGSTFPQVNGRIALVGGGVGIAPLYLAAKQVKQANPVNQVDAYLGFNETPILQENFESIADGVSVKTGGFITDNINPEGYDHLFACGPLPMLKALYAKCRATDALGRLYVSVESRMGCGLDFCAGCAIRVKSGDGFAFKKVCSDGPVFHGEEVILDE